MSLTKTEALPFDMVVIGATGDLSRRKLVPALYNLHKDGRLPKPGRIFGAARQEGGREGFLSSIEESARENMPADEWSPTVWRSFAERIDYLQLDATKPESFDRLKDKLDQPDRARIFYLATAPNLYGAISHAIADAGLIHPLSRIVLEKPIGSDLESAQAINDEVGRNFRERQIYRIDHYLGKETVQNLMALRFTNVLFEPLWRSEHIDHVQITVAETLGTEGRGGYYDQSGALRDMVQNHLLQLLCLTAMEAPARNEQEAIRGEKIKVLRSLRRIETLEDVGRKTVRGQYRAGSIDGVPVPGYLDEDEAVPNTSNTETFVALKAEIDNWRWAGVPFYLRTGKRMSNRVSEIVIQFNPVPHLLFPDQAGILQENRLVIRLQPDESIKLGLMIKVPGSKMQLKRVFLNLDLSESWEGRSPLAYERLLMDVIRGNATLFMHRDEVEEAWRWCEPILDGWQQRGDRVRLYGAGSWGPAESIALLMRDDRVWYEQVV